MELLRQLLTEWRARVYVIPARAPGLSQITANLETDWGLHSRLESREDRPRYAWRARLVVGNAEQQEAWAGSDQVVTRATLGDDSPHAGPIWIALGRKEAKVRLEVQVAFLDIEGAVVASVCLAGSARVRPSADPVPVILEAVEGLDGPPFSEPPPFQVASARRGPRLSPPDEGWAVAVLPDVGVLFEHSEGWVLKGMDGGEKPVDLPLSHAWDVAWTAGRHGRAVASQWGLPAGPDRLLVTGLLEGEVVCREFDERQYMAWEGVIDPTGQYAILPGGTDRLVQIDVKTGEMGWERVVSGWLEELALGADDEVAYICGNGELMEIELVSGEVRSLTGIPMLPPRTMPAFDPASRRMAWVAPLGTLLGNWSSICWYDLESRRAGQLLIAESSLEDAAVGVLPDGRIVLVAGNLWVVEPDTGRVSQLGLGFPTPKRLLFTVDPENPGKWRLWGGGQPLWLSI